LQADIEQLFHKRLVSTCLKNSVAARADKIGLTGHENVSFVRIHADTQNKLNTQRMPTIYYLAENIFIERNIYHVSK